MKFLLGLLSSKLLAFVYKMGNPQAQKVFAEIKPSVVKILPIYNIRQNNQNELKCQNQMVQLVDRILTAKNAGLGVDTSKLENEIDELVYELYGLTEEEIAMVEGCEVEIAASAEKPKGQKVEDSSTPARVEVEVPEPVEDDVADTPPSDYGLYKCSECGSMVMGFTKDEHVRDVHGGKSVEWKQMSGG